MGKLKTHKGLKKVLNIRQSGSVSRLVSGNNHKTGKKNHVQSKRVGSKVELHKSNLKKFKEVM